MPRTLECSSEVIHSFVYEFELESMIDIYYSFQSWWHELFSSFDQIYQNNSSYLLVRIKMFVTLKSFITFFIHATVSTLTINGMSDNAVAQQIWCGVNTTFLCDVTRFEENKLQFATFFVICNNCFSHW